MTDPYAPARPGEGHIWFVGDPHGYFDRFMPTIEAGQPDAVVLLGDMDLTRPLDAVLAEWDYDPARVWFVHGNHDADKASYWSRLPAERNLHGRVTEIAGRRIAGLGGVFRQTIWSGHAGPNRLFTVEDYLARQPPRARKLPVRHRASIFPADIAALTGQQAEILVSHEAPSTHHLGNAALDELGRVLGVSRHFHGHHHFDYEKRLAGGIFVHGVDMGGIQDDEGRVVLAGLSNPPVRLPHDEAEARKMWEEAEDSEPRRPHWRFTVE